MRKLAISGAAYERRINTSDHVFYNSNNGFSVGSFYLSHACRPWSRLQPIGNESGFVARCSDAHNNCVEMLPVFLGVMWIVSSVEGLQKLTARILIFIALRFVQSSIHVTGVTSVLIIARGGGS